MAKTLTVKIVEMIKPTEKRQEIADAVVPGLYLLVQPSGKKSWAVRFRMGGRVLKHTLGSWPDLDLVEARTAARKSLEDVARGRDPRRREVGSFLDPGRDLFETVAAQFAERHLSTLRTRAKTEAMLLPVVKAWAGRKIGEITRRDVIELIDGIADRGARDHGQPNAVAGQDAVCLGQGAGHRRPLAVRRGQATLPRRRTRDRVLSDRGAGRGLACRRLRWAIPSGRWSSC